MNDEITTYVAKEDGPREDKKEEDLPKKILRIMELKGITNHEKKNILSGVVGNRLIIPKNENWDENFEGIPQNKKNYFHLEIELLDTIYLIVVERLYYDRNPKEGTWRGNEIRTKLCYFLNLGKVIPMSQIETNEDRFELAYI